MTAREIIEAESPKKAFGDKRGRAATEKARIDAMKFKSKDEVNIGTRVLYRGTDYGFKGNVWDKANDDYYRITGSDNYRVDSFWFTPPGREFSVPGCSRQCPKEQATHVGLRGVAGGVFTWEEFFNDCIKPELYYPDRKMRHMAFEVPPDERY